ncbi:hypothetical protein P4O66_005768, partial [Electrophorus voltai]
MGTRLKVLQTFKALHRTRMNVFKEDDIALTAARLKINEEFKKNKNEISEENIQQMIKMGKAVETVLRENVLQAEHVGENKLGGNRCMLSKRCRKTAQAQVNTLNLPQERKSGTALTTKDTFKSDCLTCKVSKVFWKRSSQQVRGLCVSLPVRPTWPLLTQHWHTGTLQLLAMSEFWLCFNCCIAEQPQPKRRRRIDRSMIGEPTNFVHTAHVGSGDLFSGMDSVSLTGEANFDLP